MRDLVCFDLMETIIIPPSKGRIDEWLSCVGGQEINSYQKELFILGFPYAMYVEEKNFEKFKENMLSSSGEERLCYKGEKTDMNIEIITRKYVEFFLNNCTLNKDVFAILEKMKKDKDIKIVSNFYTVFKPLLDRYNIFREFDKIILSCDVGYRKPEEKIFEMTEYMNYRNSFFVGDNWKSDVVVPLKKGFKVFYLHERDSFIDNIYEKGCGFLIEKKEKYSIKEKYKNICNVYFGKLLDIEDIIPNKDLFIQFNNIYFSFMKNLFPIKNLKEIEI